MASLMDPSSYPVGPPCTYRASGFPDTRYMHTYKLDNGLWRWRLAGTYKRTRTTQFGVHGAGRGRTLELELELELEHNATVHRRIG